MKREVHQHGMVRTFQVLPSSCNSKPEIRSIQQLDSPPVVGLFSYLPSKPINHSKFTEICGKSQCLECHLNPVSKSKDKTKGTQKLRTSNMIMNPRLITWRVVDEQLDLNFSGISATGILEHLYSSIEDDHDDDHVNYDVADYEDGGPCDLADASPSDDFMAKFWSLHEKENERGSIEIEEYVDNDDFMANFWSLHEKENERGSVEIGEYVDDDDN